MVSPTEHTTLSNSCKSHFHKAGTLCLSLSLVYTQAPASVGMGTRVYMASPTDVRLGVFPTREALLQPSSKHPSLSALLLELGPQAIYINMFLTDMKIDFFWVLLKCSSWNSPVVCGYLDSVK